MCRLNRDRREGPALNDDATLKIQQTMTSLMLWPASGNEDFEAILIDLFDRRVMAEHKLTSKRAAVLGRGVTQ